MMMMMMSMMKEVVCCYAVRSRRHTPTAHDDMWRVWSTASIHVRSTKRDETRARAFGLSGAQGPRA